MIQLENVCKSFGKGTGDVHAVRDVSLHVQQGEIYGIIGFSGAGKSTLVRCINLLERPTSGKVRVDGQELTALPEKELRRVRKNIGMIFQHFNLLRARTVFENIAYPLRSSGMPKREIMARVRQLLELVDMQDKEFAYPSQLSGGQKQRVAIARALACNPAVLLCDEATSALDPQTTHSILQLLRKLNKTLGLTIVIITHEMAVIKEICHKVAIMEQGRVVESGDVFRVFSAPEQPVTREFIRTASSLSKVYELIEEKSPVVDIGPGEMIVQLTYLEKNISEPLVSEVSRKYGVDVNIIFSSIEIIQAAPLGGLVAIIGGSRENIAGCLEYLQEKKVRVEVIQDGAVG